MADSARVRFHVIYKFHELAIEGALQSNKKFLFLRLHSAIKWHILTRPVQ